MKAGAHILTGRALVAAALVAGSPLALPAPTLAHGGGLDANGCHTNRKTGDYHCHRSQNPAPPRTAPARATGQVYYANCAAARAAGAAPLRRGDPGYRPAMDRDDDGVACE